MASPAPLSQALIPTDACCSQLGVAGLPRPPPLTPAPQESKPAGSDWPVPRRGGGEPTAYSGHPTLGLSSSWPQSWNTAENFPGAAFNGPVLPLHPFQRSPLPFASFIARQETKRLQSRSKWKTPHWRIFFSARVVVLTHKTRWANKGLGGGQAWAH